MKNDNPTNQEQGEGGEFPASNWGQPNRRHSSANQILTPWQQLWELHSPPVSALTSDSHLYCSLTPATQKRMSHYMHIYVNEYVIM